jgi:hypothetical protein
MIFTLRREFGLSAREAYALPHWELAALMSELKEEDRRIQKEAKDARSR